MLKPEPTEAESVNQEIAAFDRFFQSLQSDGSAMVPPEKALITTYVMWVQQGRPANRHELSQKIAAG